MIHKLQKPVHLLFLIHLFFVFGCRDRVDDSATNVQNSKVKSKKLVDGNPPKGRDVWFERMLVPYNETPGRIGSHEMSARIQIVTRVDSQPPKKVEVDFKIRVDDKGQFAAVNNIGEQHGREVVWTGNWLYVRERYGKFVKRKAREGEASEILDTMAGKLPSYVRLLGRFMEIHPKGEEEADGRKVTKIELQLAPAALPAQPADLPVPAKNWRKNVVAKKLSGSIVFDGKGGIPLKADLKAKWTFLPPKAQDSNDGIPKEQDPNSIGTMELVFAQNTTKIGKIPAIMPPSDDILIEGIRRDRVEMERQMLTGERQIPRKWKRDPSPAKHVSKESKK